MRCFRCFSPRHVTYAEVQTASGELSVILKARHRARMGCTLVHVADKDLLITSITDDGRIWAWNQENPDREIRRGDRIFEVDGIRGDSKKMVEKIKKAGNVVKLRLQPRGCMNVDAESRLALQVMMQGQDLSPDDLELLAILDPSIACKEEPLDPTNEIGPVIEALPRVCARECDEDECAICLDDFTPDSIVTRLPCGHCYCTPCISAWLTQRQSHCPVCLESIIVEQTSRAEPDVATLSP